MALKLHTFTVGRLKTNCYLLVDTRTHSAILVDVGEWPTPHAALESITRLHAHLKLIVLTHAHFDHAYWAKELAELTDSPVLLHEADTPFIELYMKGGELWGFTPGSFREPDRTLHDGDTIHIDDISLRVLHTPGHTPGSVSLFCEDLNCVFTGDTLFRDAIGRTDLPGGDYSTIVDSIHRRLFSLPDHFTVFPGHGPSTTISHEKLHNEFV